VDLAVLLAGQRLRHERRLAAEAVRRISVHVIIPRIYISRARIG
jgi:hypothetical protein